MGSIRASAGFAPAVERFIRVDRRTTRVAARKLLKRHVIPRIIYHHSRQAAPSPLPEGQTEGSATVSPNYGDMT